jgi:hypothetical protein
MAFISKIQIFLEFFEAISPPKSLEKQESGRVIFAFQSIQKGRPLSPWVTGSSPA